MIETNIILALSAGFGIALIAAPMGCFVVWRRMAYFGDSLAHASLLGIALGLITGLSTNIGVLIICSLFAILLLWLQQKKSLFSDSILGILAHGSLSIGVIGISLLGFDLDLEGYLFGDILNVVLRDIIWIYFGGALILFLLIYNWSDLVLMSIDEDLARAENVKIFYLQILLMFLMTLLVAISIQIVGVLIITSMLIIPASSARQVALSPKSMAIFTSVFALIAVVFGVFGAKFYNLPAGPSIVVSLVIIFILSLIFSSFQRKFF